MKEAGRHKVGKVGWSQLGGCEAAKEGLWEPLLAEWARES